MSDLLWLSEAQMRRIEPYFPLSHGVPRVDDRRIISGIIFVIRNPLPIPTMDDTSNKGSLIAEGAEVAETNLTFGQKSLGAFKFTSGVIKVSSELLSDAAIDPEAVVRNAMAERLGRILNEMLTVGTGVAQPTGIVTGASEGVEAAAATAISYDDLVNLLHSVDPAYRMNAGFMFNDSTLRAIRLLKDANGLPLWQPAMALGEQATILGHSYFVNQDMASIASGETAALFGDFSKYFVRNVATFGVKRLDERFATSDQVGFVGFGRWDGTLTDARAVKKLVMA